MVWKEWLSPTLHLTIKKISFKYNFSFVLILYKITKWSKDLELMISYIEMKQNKHSFDPLNQWLNEKRFLNFKQGIRNCSSSENEGRWFEIPVELMKKLTFFW